MNYQGKDKLDYMISLALLDGAEKEAEEFVNIDCSDIDLGKSFDKRIYRLIKKKANEEEKKKRKIVIFRFAVVAMLIMSILFVTLMSITGIREAIWKAIVEWCDGYIAISFVQSPAAETESSETDATQAVQSETAQATGSVSGGALDNAGAVNDSLQNAVAENQEQQVETQAPTVVVTPPTEILEYREPALPDGYEKMEIFKSLSLYMLDYYLGDEWMVSFTQKPIDNNEQHIDDTSASIKNVMLGEFEAILVLSDGENTILWSDGEYSYSIMGVLTEQELIDWASSVK